MLSRKHNQRLSCLELKGLDGRSTGRLASAGLIFLLLLVRGYCFGQPSNPPDNKTYTKSVLIGTDVIPDGQHKLFLAADLTADGFFDGLRRKEIANGQVEFSKDGNRIFEYPSDISVELLCWANRARFLPGIDPQDNYSGVCESLDVQVQWKRNLQMRPVKEFKLERRGLESVAQRKHWRYFIHVNDERVPLTDQLVISVLTSEGKFVTRFSSRL